MDWNWTLLRREYMIGDVDVTARKACEHFKVNPDDVVPSLVAAVMMSDGQGFMPLVDAHSKVSVESVEDAVDRFIGNLPDGDVIARRINKTLDGESDKGHAYESPIPAELVPTEIIPTEG